MLRIIRFHTPFVVVERNGPVGDVERGVTVGAIAVLPAVMGLAEEAVDQGLDGVVDRKRWVGALLRSGVWFGRPAPRHEFVDAVLGPTVHEAGQQFGHVGQRIDFIKFAGLDQ